MIQKGFFSSSSQFSLGSWLRHSSRATCPVAAKTQQILAMFQRGLLFISHCPRPFCVFRFGGWESCLDIFLSFHLCCGCDCHMRTPALADQVGYINVFATHTTDPMRASKALFSVMDLPFDGTQSSQRDQHLPQFRSASSLVASIGARELNHSVPVGIPAGIPAGTP